MYFHKIHKKSSYYKEFKRDLEHSHGRKINNISLIDQSLYLDLFIQRKLNRAKIVLLEDIYQTKLT